MKKIVLLFFAFAIIFGGCGCSSEETDTSIHYDEAQIKEYFSKTFEFSDLYLKVIVLLSHESGEISTSNNQSYIDILGDLADIANGFVEEMKCVTPCESMEKYWEDAETYFVIAGRCAENIIACIESGGTAEDIESYTDEFTHALVVYYDPIYELY